MSTYSCKHCCKKIKNLDDAGHHNCFIGRTVYMTDNFELFCEDNHENDKATLRGERFLSETENENEPEFLNEERLVSDGEENNTSLEKAEENIKTSAWSRNSILTLLSLYEANYPKKVTHKNNQTQLWKTLSDGLQSMDIMKSAKQVRWKINYLLGRYKVCKDNNEKSGREFKTCEFYNEIDDILQKKKDCAPTYTVSSTPLTKENTLKTTNTLQLPKDTNSSLKNKEIIQDTPSSSNPPIKTNTSFSTCSKTLHQRGTQSAKSKLELESKFLHFLSSSEEHTKATEERIKKTMQIKSDANALKKQYLNLRQQDMEQRKKIAEKKLKLKQDMHNERMEIENRKLELFSKMLYQKAELPDRNYD